MDKLWRHGDVLIGAVPNIPKGAKPQPHTTLAEGEVTGHSHRVAEPDTAQLWELNGQVFLSVTAAFATLIHEEHKPITLPQGTYRIWIQREYTPQKIRQVID